jgi:FtsP/CotA-like multicopper oxidase with cupredoxin domain
MATAPFSDGTPHAAQWPIPPGHYFDYELLVPLGMAGTYFYHSHVGFQATSATGPLIVWKSLPLLFHGEAFPLV